MTVPGSSGSFSIDVASSIPGRTRLEIPWLLDNPALAAHLRARLARAPGVASVQPSPLTGRVLILHPEIPDGNDLLRLVREVGAAFTGPTRPSDRGTGVPALPLDTALTAGLAVGGVLVASVLTASPPLLVALGMGSLAYSVRAVVRTLRSSLTSAADSRGMGDAAAAVRKLYAELAPHRRAVVAAAAFGGLSIVFSLARFSVIGMAINVVIPPGKGFGALFSPRRVTPKLLALGAAGLAITAVQGVLEYAGQRIWRDLSQAVQHRLRVRAYARVQAAEIDHLDRRGRGSLVASLTEDVARVDDLAAATWESYQLVVNGGVVFAMLFATAPPVAWLSMLSIPGILVGMATLQRRAVPRFEVVQARAAGFSTLVSANLQGLDAIKSFTAERQQLERVRARSATTRDGGARAAVVASAFVPVLEFAVMAGITLTVVGGGIMSGRTVTAGSYSSMIMLTRQLLWPLTQVAKSMDSIDRGIASLRRVYELLEHPVEDLDAGRPLRRDLVRGEIAYDDVAFAYADGSPLFQGLRLRVAPGRVTAVVGPTGSGKSSLVRLLLRFHRAEAGAITLDGEHVVDLKLRDLRAAIAVVSQDAFLFAASVRDNIALGAPQADLADVVEAAKLASAHAFIEKLPQGYDTVLGERGITLSGGERQRLAIARALLKDAPILVLDEATSQLDNRTEAEFYERLRARMGGRTLLVIAHRMAATRRADYVYVMDDGRVCEEGTPDELLRRKGLYATLWNLQAREQARPDV
jgi:ATP-binding cassette subfamily B protein